MSKPCPHCHTSILRERSYRAEWRGWLRCEICAYMELAESPPLIDVVITEYDDHEHIEYITKLQLDHDDD